MELVPYGLAGAYLGVIGSGLLLKGVPFQYLLGMPILGSVLMVFVPSWLGVGFGLILTGVSVQLSGSFTSPLFLFYYLFGVLLAYRFPVQRFWVIFGLVVLGELGANLFALRPLAVLYLLPLGGFWGLLGYLRSREVGRLSELEARTRRYQARQELIEPSGVDRERVLRSLSEERVTGVGALKGPFRSLVELVRRSLGPNSCILWVSQEDGLVPVEFSSEDPACTPAPQGFKEGLLGWVAREGRPILIPDFFQDLQVLGYYGGPSPIRSFLAVPLRLGDQILGVLSVDSKEREAFGEPQKLVLEAAAHTLSLLVDLLRGYEAKHQEALRYSAIADLSSSLLRRVKFGEVIESTFQVVKGIFESDRVGFAHVDTAREKGRVVAISGWPGMESGYEFELSDGLVGWVAKHGGYLINNDLSSSVHRIARAEPRCDTRSFLGVPVQDEEGCFGVLWVEHRNPQAFSEWNAKVLRFLAALLSVALTRARLYEEVEELAIRDGLTRLYNHRKFQELLDTYIARREPLTLLLLDLDHFKEVNDRFGHQLGDEVLKGVAGVLSDLGLLAARYGGEEFAVILVGPDRVRGAERAEELRCRIKGLRFKWDLQPEVVGITVSIGLARYPEDSPDKSRLLDAADQALYRAKRGGRDRVVAYRTSEVES